MLIVQNTGQEKNSLSEKIQKIQKRVFLCKEETVSVFPKNCARLVLSLLEETEEKYVEKWTEARTLEIDELGESLWDIKKPPDPA